MNGPNSPLRIRDIPPEQATLLHQIHHLAARGVRLRQAKPESMPGSPENTQLLEHITEVGRDRDVTEIRARANGMPSHWVDQVRAAGQSGRPWTDELLLTPTRPPTGRRNTQRVAQDTRQLAGMAAFTVAIPGIAHQWDAIVEAHSSDFSAAIDACPDAGPDP
ncbi:hypothetical protein AB0L63_31560 [Nocardia sp. NPDC051990]|uniref:hypothetical protein n=1 Tax=Nocardia sp. NPDC051990 TaxID=3155285 RepID=UPI00342F97A3